MLQTKTITYEQPGFAASLTLATANVARGLLRTQLVEEGLRTPDKNPLIHGFRWMQWPALKAGTLKGRITTWTEDEDDRRKNVETIEVSDLTIDQFLELVPEELSMQWIEAVLDLNMHWLIQPSQDEPTAEDKEKKSSNK